MITYPAIEFEWIAIEVFESQRGGKGAVSVILKLDLLWFEGIYLIFGTFDFFVFLTWVMRGTVANINSKIIQFDAVDFSGHHSKKLCFFWRSVYIIRTRTLFVIQRSNNICYFVFGSGRKKMELALVAPETLESAYQIGRFF